VSVERPGMGINVKTGGFLELLELVKIEAVDFGFGIIGAVRQGDGIVIEQLREHQSRVIARVQHPLANKSGVTVKDLSEARWLMLDSEAVQRGFVNFFERNGLDTPKQTIRTDSVTLIRRVAIETDVLTILPQEAVQKKIDQGILTELDCPAPVDQSRIGVFYREDGVMTPQANFLIDQFRVAFGHAATMKKPRPRHSPSTY
jgi:DNA-binding transcriptional LysR family regulator